MPLILPNGTRTIGGTGAMIVDTGVYLHRVRNEVVGKRLQSDIDQYCEGCAWTAAVAFSNGTIVIVPRSPWLPALPPDMADLLVKVAKLANREVHHGGHWVPAFSDGVLTCLWRDHAGDLQLENTFPDTWVRLQRRTSDWWVDSLDAVHTEWKHRIANLGVHPDQMISRALGEKPRSH